MNLIEFTQKLLRIQSITPRDMGCFDLIEPELKEITSREPIDSVIQDTNEEVLIDNSANKTNEFIIDDIKSLSGKSMVAFQNAKKYLGEDFNKIIKYSMDYREVAEQMKQIELLFLHRTEVIILDINIFKYLLKHNTTARVSQPFKVHYIFNERQYSAAFKSEKNRDVFDEGIKTMKEQGTYQIIVDKYLNQQ